MVTRGLTTKDDVPLRELLDTAERILDIYDEADFPFGDLFVESTGQQNFTQLPEGEFTWEELAEGEDPRTADYDEQKRMAIETATYGRGLGFSQQFIEDHTSNQVTKRVQRLIEGAVDLKQDHIMSVINNGIADGRTLWYDVHDRGAYTFDNDHNHWFSQTSDLFSDSNPHDASKHIGRAVDHLKHHGKGDRPVVLTSAGFKRELRDEVSWDATYHVPMASGLRSQDVREAELRIEGAEIMQTEYLNGNDFYVVDAGGDKPIKQYTKRPVQLSRPQGGQVKTPGELLGAEGTARWGMKFADPLDAVYVNADDVK
jgi:hypothetical protein